MKMKHMKINNEHFMFIFIMIDGKFYFKESNDIENHFHMDLYTNCIFKHIELNKYKFYPYYYFPRGSLLINHKNKKVISNLPVEFDKEHRESIYDKLNISKYDIEEIPGEHYSIEFIKSQINSNDWSIEVRNEEIEFAVNFYLDQISYL